ncbi:unnamed protein product [Kluyveromyces dobzhanskii CBS 2104]|uniref:WGS project CCBQ000000000 data, contig 00106 n=1 Tax=Kluyveromyces dobzhanskii CBS 2104 TaxID=1427455 RepID=A0A0A8L7S8_9SACH|nr:unnamed protein product [Kluyveromyces dobzhanskii CBS 2104]
MPLVSTSLQRLLSLDVHEDPSSLLQKLFIALFTTVPGQNVVEHLTELAEIQCANNNRVDDDDEGNTFSIRRQDPCWAALFQAWSSDTQILSLFLDWLIRNERDSIDLQKYSKPSYKRAVSYLVPNLGCTFTAPLFDSSNLLIDYLHIVRPLIESIVKKMNGSQLIGWVQDHNRVYEFNGSFQWFALPRSEFNQFYTTALYERYFTSLFAGHKSKNGVISAILLLKVDLVPPSGHDLTEFRLKHAAVNGSALSEQEEYGSHSNLRSERFELFYKLGLYKYPYPLLAEQFNSLCLFVDPMTQPPPNDSHIISLDLLHDLYLGSLAGNISKSIPNYQTVWKTHLSTNLEIITLNLLQTLRIWDYQSLDDLKNIQAENPETYPAHMSSWIPYELSLLEMEILYMIAGLSFYSMYKMHADKPARLNPFLPMMLRAWRSLSSALILGLQIDRFEEMQTVYSTPVVVSAVIRGASALRSIIATILNGFMDDKVHDFKHEPFGGFMSPYGRKLCNGALYTNVMFFFTALLPSGMDSDEIVELLSHIQRGDRIDEDVRYMFDYEYFDYNDADTNMLAEDKLMFSSTKSELEQKKRFRMLRGFYKRCDCKFSDEEDDIDDSNTDEEESVVQSSQSSQKLPDGDQGYVQDSTDDKPTNGLKVVNTARRFQTDVTSHLPNGYCKNGEDWRDMPRGLNLYYMNGYHFMSKLSRSPLFEILRRLPDRNVTFSQAHTILRSVATCVKLEQEQILLKVMTSSSGEENLEILPFTSDEVIALMFKDDGGIAKPFPFSGCNDSLGWKLFDELMMSYGHRRLLIHHLTHRLHTFSSIHYVYELLFGLRGTPVRSYDSESMKNKQLGILSWTPVGEFEKIAAIEFSRQGVIELSTIEKKMLLQEFFVGVSSGLLGEYQDTTVESFATNGESQVQAGDEFEDILSFASHKAEMVGKVKMVCFLLEEVLNDKEFEFVAEEDYVYELKSFLIQWSAISPDACSVYALLKSKAPGKGSDIDIDTEEFTDSGSIHSDDRLLPANFDELELNDIYDNADQDNDTCYQKGEVSKTTEERFSRMLPIQSLEGNPIEKAFRYLIRKYDVNKSVPVYGRRVIEYCDKILPLDIRTHQSLHREFLAVFGIDYLDILQAQQQEAEEECDEMPI